MDMDRFRKTIESQEGYEQHAYLDSKGVLIVGMGLNLRDVGYKGKKYNSVDAFAADYPDGLTDDEINEVFDEKVDHFVAGVKDLAEQKDVDWDSLSDIRQEVLANMAFNMGIDGIGGFPAMWKHLSEGDYINAAKQMLEGRPGYLSGYVKDTRMRAINLALCMATDSDLPLGLD